MKNIAKFGVLTCALATPILTYAATTADIKLIGTITPAACVPNFTGGSTIDYGNIPSNTLSVNSQTLLPQKTTKLTVACDAPVKFAFTITDERSATAVTTLNTLAGYSEPYKFGLGAADNGAKIGAYSLQLSNETADSGATRRLTSSDDGATWATFTGGLATTNMTAFGNSATATAPSAHKSIVVDLLVVAAIDKAANLPITDEIKIDGLTTFEVKYL